MFQHAKKAQAEEAKLAEEEKAMKTAKIPVRPAISEPAFGDIRSLMSK